MNMATVTRPTPGTPPPPPPPPQPPPPAPPLGLAQPPARRHTPDARLDMPQPRSRQPTAPAQPMGRAKFVAAAITFDDVLILPRRSAVMPAEADPSARLTRTIRLNIPLISAPMDTVTDSALAIGLAQEGGIGI